MGRISKSGGAAPTPELQDALARLHDRNTVRTALLGEENFTYDAASNLMATGTDDWSIAPREVRSTDFGGKGFAHDGAGHIRHNRLTELNGFAFTYDAFGRTIVKEHAETRRKWLYAYNSESQLTEVTVIGRRGFSKTRFTYDALGRRTGKTNGQSETRFIWSGMRLLSESRGETRSTYVYEYNSYAPLARLDSWNAAYFAEQGRPAPPDKTKVYYFHCNASGMPEEMTDKDGNIVWRARYAIWSKVVFENVTSHPPSGFEQNLRMQGQYHDRETGLHYNTFRYYDCDTGRFTTEDPIGLLGGMNLYQYAPNPLMWIDPWGWAKEGALCGKTKGVSTQVTSRRDAMRSAKRDLDIPNGQRPDSVRYVAMTDRSGKPILGENHKPIMTREYTYSRQVNGKQEQGVIQDHSAGHTYGPLGTPGNQGAHVNVRPINDTRNGTVPGTYEHYNY